jgi:hypothetical protein
VSTLQKLSWIRSFAATDIAAGTVALVYAALVEELAAFAGFHVNRREKMLSERYPETLASCVPVQDHTLPRARIPGWGIWRPCCSTGISQLSALSDEQMNPEVVESHGEL